MIHYDTVKALKYNTLLYFQRISERVVQSKCKWVLYEHTTPTHLLYHGHLIPIYCFIYYGGYAFVSSVTLWQCQGQVLAMKST